MFTRVTKLIAASNRSRALAAKALAELLPPGTPVEFRIGNMACVHNATVITTAIVGRGDAEVLITNGDTGVKRAIPLSAIVPSLDDQTGRPLPLPYEPPKCDQCKRETEATGRRIECGCGAMLCGLCYGNCKECNQ